MWRNTMKRRDLLKAGVAFASAQMIGGGLALTPSKARAANGKVKLKIGHLPITDHLLIMAASLEKFKSVEIEPVRFSSWPDIAEALKAGAIDGGFLLTPIGLKLRQKGVPLNVVLLGHRNGSVITVKTGDEITKIEDLKDRKIAIPSPFSTHNIVLRKLLTERGINPDTETTLIDMAPPEMPVALATGRIDGYIVAEPFGAQAEFQKVGKVLILSRDIWKDHICCVLNIREEVISKYPEAVKEIVDGMQRTAVSIKQNPATSAKESVKYLGQRPEIIEYVLTKPAGRLTFNNLSPEFADFNATQELMIKFGLTKESVDIHEYLDNRFVLG
jgi:NitT/TauT family transport system substrate-binding protein